MNIFSSKYDPKFLGTNTLLYINCEVNGCPVKALIDPGARISIMSSSFVERNKMRSVNPRWSEMIRNGEDVQNIIGRVFEVQLVVENNFFSTSFVVMLNTFADLVLGIDMLRNHQCCIDFKKNVLRIGTSETETTILPESELPESVPGYYDPLLASDSEGLVRGTILPTDPFDVDLVEDLMNYGYDEEDILFELRRLKGDRNEALAALHVKALESREF